MSGLDLYQTQSALWLVLVWGIATGFCLGGFCDLLRALRILTGLQREKGSTPLLRVVLFFGDLLLALTASVAWILLCYYTNDGQPRAPAVWGMAGGFFVYAQTIGRLTIKVEVALSRLLKQVVGAVFSLLSRPLLWVASTVHKLARKAWRALFGRAIDKRRERKARRQAERQADKQKNLPTETVPPKGTTVFSTHTHP